jgi:hypothetical protein
MNKIRSLPVRVAGAAALLTLTVPVHAAQLLSPQLWTGFGNASACVVRNIGVTPVKVQVSLFSNFEVSPIDDTCNTGLLAPGKTCAVFAQKLADDAWVACSATASTSNLSKLRGTVELRHFGSKEQGFKVVVAEDLR